MANITGKSWAFLMVNSNHEIKIACPGMITLQEVYFDIEVDGLKRNFYDNSRFTSKEEAIEAMRFKLEQLENE
jgi:hypothetical protein